MQDKHHIDDLFKQAFNNFEADPPPGAWEGIAYGLFDQGFIDAFSGLEETPSLSFDTIEADLEPADPGLANAEFDSAIKKKLKNFEKEPSAGVWNNIRKYIPLNLFVRNSLTQLSKVAASLLVGLIIVFTMGYFGVIDRIQDYFQQAPPSEPKALLDTKDTEAIVTNDQDLLAGKEEASVINVVPDVTVFNNLLSEDTSEDVSENNVDAITENRVVLYNENETDFLTENTTDVAESIIVIPTKSMDTQGVELSDPSSTGSPASENVQENDIILSQEIISESEIISEPAAQKRTLQFEEDLQSAILATTFQSEPVISIKGDEYANMEQTNLKRGNHLSRRMDNLKILETLTFKGWYFNLYAQVNNTWVLNQDIRRMVSASGTAEHVLDIGAAYGAGLGFQITPRIALEANWLHTRQGQRYQEFTEAGVYKTSELNTTYNYFPVWAKIQASRMKDAGGKAMTWNYKVGLHYGRLDAAILNTGEEGVAFTENLVKNEIGFDLGLEMRLFLDPKFFISVGAHGAYGMDASVFSGNSTNTTGNLNLGLQLGIHYRLRK